MQENWIGHFSNKQVIVGPIVKRYSSCFTTRYGHRYQQLIVDICGYGYHSYGCFTVQKVYSLLRNIHFYHLFRAILLLFFLLDIQLFVYFSLSSPSRDDPSWIDESSPAVAPAASDPARPLFSPKREEGIPPIPRLKSFKIKIRNIKIFSGNTNTLGIWNPTIQNLDFLKVGFQRVRL